MKILILVASLIVLLTPKGIATEPPALYQDSAPPVDKRIVKLENFFNKYNCPKPNYAENYISAADKVSLDYRLLPAISILESTCGKHQVKNNWWGWDSARTGFSSVAEGINFISRQLAEGRYYKGLTLEQKLGRYNSVNPSYKKTILSLMQKINAE